MRLFPAKETKEDHSLDFGRGVTSYRLIVSLSLLSLELLVDYLEAVLDFLHIDLKE